jgi:F420-dependent oxidoreductase-like protein
VRVRTSLFLDYDVDPRSTVALVYDADAAGIDTVWVAEAYGFDAVSLLGYLAAETDRIGLASGILPLGTRSPALLAMTAAGIDALSGGRFTLGVGTSGPQVIEGLHGVSFDRPLVRTRETIDVCRMAWRREAVEYSGETIELPQGDGRALKLITTPVRDRIPVTLAAIGPKNVELAAELAEGWLPMFGFFHPDRWREVWDEPLARGRRRRDAALGELEIVAGSDLAIGTDAVRHRERSRAQVALYVGGMGSRQQNFYNDLFRRYGYEDEARVIQDLFLDRKREEAAAAVPDEFLTATSLCGDEDFVRAQVTRYRDAGVTDLVVRPVGDDRAGTLRALVEIVRELAPAS